MGRRAEETAPKRESKKDRDPDRKQPVGNAKPEGDATKRSSKPKKYVPL